MILSIYHVYNQNYNFMKAIKLIILGILIHAGTKAQEYNNKHIFYIDIGLTGGSYKNSSFAGGYGSVGLFFNSLGRQAAIDIKSKENYLLSPESEFGALSLTYRLYFSRGLYLGIGGAHNHWVAINHFNEDPIGSIFATNQHIIHRTGLIAEIGYDFKSLIPRGWLGMYPATNLSFTYMPGYKDPIPIVNLSIGVKFGLKRKENL